MSTYYYLVNDTKKQTLHLDCHVKSKPIISNGAVHCAMANYMFDNQGDTMRMIGDNDDTVHEYEDVNLLEYPFSIEIMQKIVKML